MSKVIIARKSGKVDKKGPSPLSSFTASLAKGKFEVSKEGYVTNKFTETGGDVSFTTGLTGTESSFTNTALDIASSTVSDGQVSNSVVNGAKSSTTTNTLTSATTSVVNGTDSVVNLTTATANTQTVTNGTDTNTTTDTAISHINTITDGSLTSTITADASGLSVKGAGGYGMDIDTTTGITTFESANNTANVPGGATTTTIDGNTITTGTLTTDKLIINSATGTFINLSEDGSASLASGKFEVSAEGYVTNQFTGTGGDVSFTTGLTGTESSFTNTAGDIASSTVSDGQVSNSVMNGTNGSTTTNTLTSATTSVTDGTTTGTNSVTASTVSSGVVTSSTISSSVITASSITDTVMDATNTSTSTSTATSTLDTFNNGTDTTTIAKDYTGMTITNSASSTNQTVVSSTDVSITDPDDSTSRISLSDVGQVSTMDSELLNSNNGSTARNTVMSGLNNEASIRRREIARLDGELDGVGASAAALAGLNPLEYDPDNKFSVAAAYGSYDGSSAVALGAFYRPNENVMVNFGASMGSGENLFTVGVAFALDKNPNYGKSTKRAMLQNIKTLQMENGKIANDMGSIQMKNKELAKQNAALNARLDAIEKMLAKKN